MVFLQEPSAEEEFGGVLGSTRVGPRGIEFGDACSSADLVGFRVSGGGDWDDEEDEDWEEWEDDDEDEEEDDQWDDDEDDDDDEDWDEWEDDDDGDDDF